MSLYLVATPIGNLDDITYRATKTLREVDFIICEDTRHTLALLNHLGIKKPLISYHQHSKLQKIEQIVESLKRGQNAAMVSDAGTPGLSDPGGLLVKKAAESEIEITAIPGVSALATIISLSGMETHEYCFYGFLPNKKGRQKKITEIITSGKSAIIYESPYRIKKLLNELLEHGGDREVVIGRELTKKFETIYRGHLSAVLGEIIEKGEFVVLVKGEN